MSKLSNLSITDLKSAVDFLEQQKNEQIELNDRINTEKTIALIEKHQYKLRMHLFSRVNQLKNFDDY